MAAHASPASPPPNSTSVSSATAGTDLNDNANAVAAAAPTTNCPSAPMLNTPARKATATASPVRISGVARTSVPDPIAYHEPSDPLTSAVSARDKSNPLAASNAPVPPITN